MSISRQAETHRHTNGVALKAGNGISSKAQQAGTRMSLVLLRKERGGTLQTATDLHLLRPGNKTCIPLFLLLFSYLRAGYVERPCLKIK